MRFRASEQQWDQVRRLTDSSFVRGIDSPLEMGCIILFAENNHPARPSLLASYVLAPSQGELLHQTAGALTLSSQYLRRALLAVRERGLKGFFYGPYAPAGRQGGQFFALRRCKRSGTNVESLRSPANRPVRKL